MKALYFSITVFAVVNYAPVLPDAAHATYYFGLCCYTAPGGGRDIYAAIALIHTASNIMLVNPVIKKTLLCSSYQNMHLQSVPKK